MKKVLLYPTVWLSTILIMAVTMVFTACDNGDDPKVVPTVTTSTPTDVTPSTATVAGEITSDGGTIVLAAGICYSGTNATPTVADDTTKTAVLTGKFTSHLTDLASGTTYHVRAYATNSVGTAYGEVMTFTTGNEAPTATNVVINGEIKGDMDVTVTYDYKDKENDVQIGTTIQWYRADNAAGLNKIAIDGATTNTYHINLDDQGKVIWVGVTPRAATGTLLGVEAISDKKGPIGDVTTVTFMYNGNEVTYGIINSSKTGRRWLDRNLGAPNVPSAYNDYANLGDLFQWGRLADGHQLVARTPDVDDPFHGSSAAINDVTTTTLSPSDTPADNKFVTPSALPFDWRATVNNTLWQGVNGINNPCPKGWRIPTIDEWTNEQFTDDHVSNFTKLKLTNTGTRYTDGSFSATNYDALYWSSTTVLNAGYNESKTFVISDGNMPSVSVDFRGNASACRCIKDENQ